VDRAAGRRPFLQSHHSLELAKGSRDPGSCAVAALTHGLQRQIAVTCFFRQKRRPPRGRAPASVLSMMVTTRSLRAQHAAIGPRHDLERFDLRVGVRQRWMKQLKATPTPT